MYAYISGSAETYGIETMVPQCHGKGTYFLCF